MTPLEDFLSRLTDVVNHGDYWTARCPAHEDRVSSLSINTGDDGRVLVTCHAGCERPAVVHAVGMTMSGLFPDHAKNGKSHKPKGSLVASYDYFDADGALQFQSCRYEKEADDGTRTKSFQQRRPNGQGGWIYDRKNTTNVPYRLPELIKSHKSETVYIVEGEKHVDRLRELGFVATCNAGGAGKWLKSFNEFLVGRDVVILPDNDDAGQKHAEKAAGFLKDVANSVRVVPLPNLPPKGDVIDWLAAGGTADGLRQRVEAAPKGVPEPKPKADPVTLEYDLNVVAALGLTVLREDESGRVKVFSKFHRKISIIRDMNRLSCTELIQICGGPAVRQTVWTNDGETPDGMYRLKTVKESIAAVAGCERKPEETEIGPGLWSLRSANQENTIVLVGDGESVLLGTDGVPEVYLEPVYAEHILDIGCGEEWFDSDNLCGWFRDYTPEWSIKVVEELEEIFGHWAFGRHQDVMACLLSGLVLATWSQTSWRWRPQVFILGKSNSGKTTLFEFLAGNGTSTVGLFGKLVVSSGDVTAAGISQSVGNSSRAVILDEMENSRRRQSVLDLLRNSGRGGRKVRGTAFHKAESFGLRHICWAAATESGLKKEVDRNRFVVVKLGIPPGEEMGRLKIPAGEHSEMLGQRLLAVAAKTSLAACDIWERITDRKVDGYHHRVMQSYAVPAAAYAAAAGLSDDAAYGLLEAFLATTDPEEIESDEDRLLAAIRDSIIDIKPGVRESVQQAVMRHELDPDNAWALDRFGISILSEEKAGRGKWIDGQNWCVFLRCDTIAKNLLSRDDEWKGVNVKELLTRLPRAVECRKLVSGSHPRGLLIPMSLIVEDVTDDSF